MKLLADENMDAPIVAWLRAAGVDILAVYESHRGMTDAQIIELAAAEDRVILTHDLDFGELVFHQGAKAMGIILLRVHPIPRLRLAAVQHFWQEIAIHARGNFVVVTDNKLRIRPLNAGQA